MIAGPELAVDHKMNALAGRHHRLDRSAHRNAVLLAKLVYPNTGGIDHTLGIDRIRSLCFSVLAVQTDQLAAFMLQAGRSTIIEQQRATLRRAASQCHGQARVIKLGIPILDAAF